MDNIAPVEWKPEQAVPRGPFASADDAKSALKTFAISEGFTVVVKSLYHNCVVLACSQGGLKRSHKASGTAASEGLRTQRTKKVGCLYEFTIKANGPGSWVADVAQGTHMMHLKLPGSTICSLSSTRHHLKQQHDVKTSIEEGYAAGIESESHPKKLPCAADGLYLPKQQAQDATAARCRRDWNSRCVYDRVLLHGERAGRNLQGALAALERCLSRQLGIVVVDHEKALINAVQPLWPTAQIDLCRWHVGKNITANFMTKGMPELAFKKVIESWNRAVKTSSSEQDFPGQWSLANDDLFGCDSSYPWHQTPRDAHTVRCLQQAFFYINKNKPPLIDRIAGYSVDQHLHFGHTTASRAEGAHWSSIKLHLQRARGSLLDVYDRIDKSTKSRLARLPDTLNRERVEIFALPMSIFAPVLRCITHFALKQAHKESAWGLHCAHEISQLIRPKTALAPADFHSHWYKEMLGCDPDVDEVLDLFTVERTQGRPPSEQRARVIARAPSRFEVVEAECAPKRPNKCAQCCKPVTTNAGVVTLTLSLVVRYLERPLLLLQ